MPEPREDQLVERLVPDFVTRDEGIPLWKQWFLGSFFPASDILSCLRFADHRGRTDGGNYFMDERGFSFRNAPLSATNSARGSMNLVPSLWAGYPGFTSSPTRTNLVENPSFEISATNFWANAFTVASRALSNEWSVAGGQSLRVTHNAGASAYVYNGLGVAGIPVSASTSYEFSAYFRTEAASGADAVQIRINWYTGAGALISSATVDTEGNLDDVMGRRLQGVETSPGTAAYVTIFLYVLTPTANYVVHWDAIQCCASAGVTAYLDGDKGDGFGWSGVPHNSTSVRTYCALQTGEHEHIFNGRTQYTIAQWVQMPRDSTDPDWPATNTVLWDISDGTNDPRVFVSWIASTQVLRLYMNGAARLDRQPTFDAGDWVHVVITIDYTNDSYKMYFNGELLGESNVSLAPGTGLTIWNIGTDRANGSHGDVVLAENVAFSRVLSIEEIARLYMLRRPIIDGGAINKDQAVGIVVYRNSSQSIPTGASTGIVMDSIWYNEGLVLDRTGTAGVVWITQPGWYVLSGSVGWASNATGYRRLQIHGTQLGSAPKIFTIQSCNALNGSATYQTVTTIEYLVPGDYVQLVGNQNSGGNLNVFVQMNYGNFFRVVKVRNLFSQHGMI